GPGRRTRAAANHGRNAGHQRLVDLLRADEMNMRVDAAGGDNHALAGDDLGARADDDVHPRLDVGITRLAQPRDRPVLDRDIALDDAPPIDDQRIGDHRVRAVLGAALALAHAIANHLAAAELDLLAVDGEVALDLDDEVRIGQANAIADG